MEQTRGAKKTKGLNKKPHVADGEPQPSSNPTSDATNLKQNEGEKTEQNEKGKKKKSIQQQQPQTNKQTNKKLTRSVDTQGGWTERTTTKRGGKKTNQTT